MGRAASSTKVAILKRRVEMEEERALYRTYSAEERKYFMDLLRRGGAVEQWAVSEIKRLEQENWELRREMEQLKQETDEVDRKRYLYNSRT